jgi:hypothetical protein
MGRPPIGKTAMSASERQTRHMARLRQRAAAPPAPGLLMDPERSMDWLYRQLNVSAISIISAVCDRHIADRTNTIGSDGDDSD